MADELEAVSATTETHSANPVAFREGSWGFWCECWVDWTGGYLTEAEANRACADYANTL